ncbi:MAG: hypothetical protein ACXIVQ_13560 [Acidimicrobiales bacterium]
MATTYWTFRLTLTDQPGGLAHVADALARLGANILDVDVHLVDRTDVADDIVVELPFWCEPAAVEHALRQIGVQDISARRLDPHELTDSPTRAIDVAARLVRSAVTDADIADILPSLVRCERIWLGPAPGLRPCHLAERALARSAPVVQTAWLSHLSSGGRPAPAWVAAVPWGPRLDQVACLARRSLRFTATEVARAQSLLSLAASLREGRSLAAPSARRP